MALICTPDQKIGHLSKIFFLIFFLFNKKCRFLFICLFVCFCFVLFFMSKKGLVLCYLFMSEKVISFSDIKKQKQSKNKQTNNDISCKYILSTSVNLCCVILESLPLSFSLSLSLSLSLALTIGPYQSSFLASPLKAIECPKRSDMIKDLADHPMLHWGISLPSSLLLFPQYIACVFEWGIK